MQLNNLLWYNSSIMENTQEQHSKQKYDWLKGYMFKKGQSGNPGGRKKGSKSLKTFVREYLESLPDEEKIQYLKTVDTELVWKMAEGNPETRIDTDLNIKVEKLNNLVKATRELLK